jgi:hypothetical protein
MSAIRSIKQIRLLFPVVACVATMASISCSGGDSSPTAPSAPTTPASTPAPNAKGSVQVTVRPNPVPFSGQPIPAVASCANLKNTWFYDQILQETGGVAVTFTSRIDKFDGRVVNSLSGLSLAVPASGSLTINSRWCSSQAVAHTAQTTFTGTDARGNAITVEGAVANLRSP